MPKFNINEKNKRRHWFIEHTPWITLNSQQILSNLRFWRYRKFLTNIGACIESINFSFFIAFEKRITQLGYIGNNYKNISAGSVP